VGWDSAANCTAASLNWQQSAKARQELATEEATLENWVALLLQDCVRTTACCPTMLVKV